MKRFLTALATPFSAFALKRISFHGHNIEGAMTQNATDLQLRQQEQVQVLPFLLNSVVFQKNMPPCPWDHITKAKKALFLMKALKREARLELSSFALFCSIKKQSISLLSSLFLFITN